MASAVAASHTEPSTTVGPSVWPLPDVMVRCWAFTGLELGTVLPSGCGWSNPIAVTGLAVPLSTAPGLAVPLSTATGLVQVLSTWARPLLSKCYWRRP
jgi:hypothetical protein